MGGVIHAPEADTCNGKVYDFFVVAAGWSDYVQGVFTIGDAGLHPHSPARLIVRGTPWKVMVRMLKTPPPPYPPCSPTAQTGRASGRERGSVLV